ncbi:MAG: sigma-70 family RNA polymerase sigma factor [Fuerstiella sp.]
MGADIVAAGLTVTELVAQARQGAGSRLGDLLDLFQPLLLAVAERSIGKSLKCRMSTSDLVQETMLTASRRFPAFRGDSEAELRNWLLEILQSRLADGLRRHGVAERRRQQAEIHNRSSQLADKALSPSELVSLEEEAGQLMLALQQLPDDLRDILSMRYFEDMTFDAIAQMRGVSTATVWRRWAEAVQILKQFLQETDGGVRPREFRKHRQLTASVSADGAAPTRVADPTES